MQTADTVKTFYNSNFFQDGNPIRTKVAITFTDEKGNQVSIPGVEVTRDTTLGEIMVVWHQYLKTQQPVAAPTQAATDKNFQPAAAAAPLSDIEQIEYNKNRYLVQVNGKDDFKITNIASGKNIDATTPVGKTILKMYNDGLQ